MMLMLMPIRLRLRIRLVLAGRRGTSSEMAWTLREHRLATAWQLRCNCLATAWQQLGNNAGRLGARWRLLTKTKYIRMCSYASRPRQDCVTARTDRELAMERGNAPVSSRAFLFGRLSNEGAWRSTASKPPRNWASRHQADAAAGPSADADADNDVDADANADADADANADADADLPNDIPKEEHKDLKEELKVLLRYHEIPDCIWQKLNAERFLTLRDFTKRWGSEADLVREALGEYLFRHADLGFDAIKARITLAKLRQVWEDACDKVKVRKSTVGTSAVLLRGGGGVPSEFPTLARPSRRCSRPHRRAVVASVGATRHPSSRPDRSAAVASVGATRHQSAGLDRSAAVASVWASRHQCARPDRGAAVPSTQMNSPRVPTAGPPVSTQRPRVPTASAC